MDQPRPVRHLRGVTVIGGGMVTPADLSVALSVAPLLVAADGGADRALALGHAPDWVIGDLDSISDPARRSVPAARVLEVAEQDSTDFAKCLGRIDAPLVMAVGFAGLRLDHTLAALTVMVQPGVPRVVMLASDDVIVLCPPRLTLPLMPGTRVSLYPMDRRAAAARAWNGPSTASISHPGQRVGTRTGRRGWSACGCRGRCC
ncbi:thiamine pyrophosphokinase [Paracoccus sp. NBH48]|uniref:thiamine pyrophosphokinase n=1 Tax=Paracoccus sp. NBH48 TaxID=2596918 RepID=UPI00351C9A88